MKPASNTAIEEGATTPTVILPVRRVRAPMISRIEASPSLTGQKAEVGEFARRAFNVASALLMLLITAPLFLIIAGLIKLTSNGPVIYKQTRVGIDRRHGKPGVGSGRRRIDYGGELFTIYKFRTMVASPESTLQVWASPSDARVTPLGRVLRKFRLDELPQLLNVLKGDMNIVGPRPEQPKIFMELRESVEGYALRQRVLPGITGWAQINHPYDRCIDDVKAKVRYDLEYIRRQSTLGDLRILLMTFPVVFFGKGAL